MSKMNIYPLSESFEFGKYLQCSEILSGLLLTLLLVKSIQYLLVWCRNNKVNNVENYSAFYSLPGPKPFPIRFIGNSFILLKNSDLMETIVSLAQKYGECFRFSILGHDYVYLNSPDMVQALLNSNDNSHLSKGGIEEMLWPEQVKALVMLPGKKWRVRRKMLDRSFTYKALQEYNPVFNQHTERLLKELEALSSDGKEHDIEKVVSECVLRATSETLMGVTFGDAEAEIFCECTQALVETGFQRVRSPWLHLNWIWRLHPASRKIDKLLDKMAQVANKVIKTHFDKLDKIADENSGSSRDQGESDDTESSLDSSRNVVDVMLQHEVSKEDIFHEVAALLAIGHDTTSLSITYLLFLFALNPREQKICREEIDVVFSDPRNYDNGILNFRSLGELKYLERCIYEAQRIFPLASAVRKLETPLKINDDLVVPAGVIAVTLAMTLHMNPKYFPNPEEFDPDRFLPEQVKARHTCAYFPFSKGPRNCIGMKLAMVELKVVVAKILHTFEVSTTDKKEDVRLVLNGMPRPAKPINFTFRKRKI